VLFQQAGNSSYGAAKGGIIGLSQSLAKELYADDIRVNCIGAGLFRAPLADGQDCPFIDQLLRRGSFGHSVPTPVAEGQMLPNFFL
jgi:3-oxoacyl-[acyl-carrier protein] reductase